MPLELVLTLTLLRTKIMSLFLLLNSAPNENLILKFLGKLVRELAQIRTPHLERILPVETKEFSKLLTRHGKPGERESERRKEREDDSVTRV